MGVIVIPNISFFAAETHGFVISEVKTKSK